MIIKESLNYNSLLLYIDKVLIIIGETIAEIKISHSKFIIVY